jgi:Na+-transporting NADH:ubiquinone oxidoreductase subunit D
MSMPVACCNTGPRTLRQTVVEGLWSNNPVIVQVLGLCTTLATTNKLASALVMGVSVILTCAGTNLVVSLLRQAIPTRIRMVAELTIVSVFVMSMDLFLRAFSWELSKQLGPYVSLIIANCIILGRAEACAMQNKPFPALVDGAANGAGYALVLAAIAAVREGLGSGQLLGFQVLSLEWFTPCRLMILGPGAFLSIGLAVMLSNILRAARQKKEGKKP